MRRRSFYCENPANNPMQPERQSASSVLPILRETDKQPTRDYPNLTGNPANAPRCGAYARTTGNPCEAPAVRGRKRCRMHGGKGSGAPPGNRNAAKNSLPL